MEADPMHRIAQAMAASPGLPLARAIENDPIQRFMRAMKNDPVHRFMRAMESTAHSPEMLSFLHAVESVQRYINSNPDVVKFTRISQDLASKLEPYNQRLASLSTNLARVVEPYQPAFSALSTWDAQLKSQMAGLNASWVLPDHLDQSMIGFARLIRLSQAAHTINPYETSVSELVVGELGSGVRADSEEASTNERDALAIGAGLNPQLIAFPPENYNRVVALAGFAFRFSGPPLPEEFSDDRSFDPAHGFVLTEIEQRLRQLVQTKLQAIEGNAWIKRRVSEPVRKRWAERASEDRDTGRPTFPLIQYADFMDLADIIGQTNNWREAFEPIFLNQHDFATSLRRLHPVRKAIAHSRPLGRADVLTLVSEATRILGSLGISVLG